MFRFTFHRIAVRLTLALAVVLAFSSAQAWACGCPCATDSDCHDGEVCSPSSGTCVDPGGPCDEDADCGGGQRCNPSTGLCQDPSDECACDDDCDDALFCNGAEHCDIFTGCHAGSLACDDGVACTVDSCDEDLDSCASAPSDAACDDGVYCNGAETCDAGAGCVVASPVDCSADDEFCGVGSCDEETKGCVVVPQNEGLDCTEGDPDACVVSSVCGAGECVVTPLCDQQCERCDSGSCASLCGNPWGSATDTINTTDALFTLRVAVELEQCELCVCDVDGSGAVTSTDVLMMLRQIVGLEDVFVCSPSAGPDETTTTTTLPIF
ncbi:MAG TPA: hypothetical protein VFO62_10035 [Candidatus Binatia bacterium]|nr:hypothetical protein [Candidatus Binatia bacterium]